MTNLLIVAAAFTLVAVCQADEEDAIRRILSRSGRSDHGFPNRGTPGGWESRNGVESYGWDSRRPLNSPPGPGPSSQTPIGPGTGPGPAPTLGASSGCSRCAGVSPNDGYRGNGYDNLSPEWQDKQKQKEWGNKGSTWQGSVRPIPGSWDSKYEAPSAPPRGPGYPGGPGPSAGYPGGPGPSSGYPGGPGPSSGYPGGPGPSAGYPGGPGPSAGYPSGGPGYGGGGWDERRPAGGASGWMGASRWDTYERREDPHQYHGSGGGGGYGGGPGYAGPSYGSGSPGGSSGYGSGSPGGSPGYGSGSPGGSHGYGSGSPGGSPGYGSGSPGYGSGSPGYGGSPGYDQAPYYGYQGSSGSVGPTEPSRCNVCAAKSDSSGSGAPPSKLPPVGGGRVDEWQNEDRYRPGPGTWTRPAADGYRPGAGGSSGTWSAGAPAYRPTEGAGYRPEESWARPAAGGPGGWSRPGDGYRPNDIYRPGGDSYGGPGNFRPGDERWDQGAQGGAGHRPGGWQDKPEYVPPCNSCSSYRPGGGSVGGYGPSPGSYGPSPGYDRPGGSGGYDRPSGGYSPGGQGYTPGSPGYERPVGGYNRPGSNQYPGGRPVGGYDSNSHSSHGSHGTDSSKGTNIDRYPGHTGVGATYDFGTTGDTSRRGEGGIYYYDRPSSSTPLESTAQSTTARPTIVSSTPEPTTT